MCEWPCVCQEINPYLVVLGVQGVHLILALQGHQGDQRYLLDLEYLVHLKSTHTHTNIM